LLAFSNTLVPYTTSIIIDAVSPSDVLGVLLNLTVLKISSASFFALFMIFLLLFSSFSYIRISTFLENLSKIKFVSSVMSVN